MERRGFFGAVLGGVVASGAGVAAESGPVEANVSSNLREYLRIFEIERQREVEAYREMCLRMLRSYENRRTR